MATHGYKRFTIAATIICYEKCIIIPVLLTSPAISVYKKNQLMVSIIIYNQYWYFK